MTVAWQLVTDRFAVIRRHLRPGTVLDIGCVDARPRREGAQTRIERKPDLLFRRIVEICPQTLGVDIDAPGVEVLRRSGYQVVQADAETMDLGERFDTIIAGELIEHLENPGRFLRNMHRHLRAGGNLILSTPNPFASGRAWNIWRRGFPQVHEDHTCWFDPITLGQLLRRTGFEPVTGYWIHRRGKLLKSWPKYFRRYFANAFLIVARPTYAERLAQAPATRPSAGP